MTADGVPKVGDFGLARATSFAASDPDAVAVAGTPDYMAPEAVDPLAIDVRSDLYALGCILCELATGAPPYRGATAFALLQAHRTAPLPALADVPDGLRRVIRWLLAKSPADRPQSASEVETALASLATSTALVPAGDTAVAGRRACTRCGACGPQVVHVCFACGQPQLELAPGAFTVFVTGPGNQVEKIDASLRQKLLAWLAANPAIGLDAKLLTKVVPRLPFVLVAEIDDSSAKALVSELRKLGFEAEAVEGGRFALRTMRSKGWTIAKRIGLICLSSFYMFRYSWVTMMIGGVIVGMPLWRGFRYSFRPLTQLSGTRPAQLPSAIDAALARVATVVRTMEAARHRDALRGVVERALALREVTAADDQIAHLIDVAALAASRLDQLETELSPEDLRSDDEAKRARWQRRDRWAARLLQVTAFLDAMRARAVMAKARGAANAADLDDLRAHIAALEEVS
jgi:hypothetical protein